MTVTTTSQPIKILVLAANPLDTTPLLIDEEIRAIDAALQKGEFHSRFSLRQHLAVHPDELQELLERHRPTIVHFSGHGGETGEILLHGEDGNRHPVSAQALSNLFRLLKDNVRCVVLNACYSNLQAQAIAEHIDVVIGVSNTLGDQAAVKFAAGVYLGIASGHDLQTAFEWGCARIDLANLNEPDKPKLIALHSNPSEIVLAQLALAQKVSSTQRATSKSKAQEELCEGLQNLLERHKKNLLHLKEKKAIYASGEEPLHLTNQIEQAEQEMSRTQAELQDQCT